MKFFATSTPCLAVLILLAPYSRSTFGQSGELTFTLAPGLTIEKVADESLVKWPMLADWDSKGRLVVVESAGVAKPIEKHNEQRLHRIVRLIDENGDGVMDRRIIAADKLPFTEGVLCLGNSMLITAPPNIWKLTDSDDDGFCEQREVWFDGQTLTGCANDLHGPYLGRDGWVYWCKGAFAKQRHEVIGGQVLEDGAAHIYRRREFGLSATGRSLVEAVMSGGMDNPVEVASLPNGERFFTSTFLVHPGDGKRDGVAHAIYGGAYGKDHNALDGVVRTGTLMPIMAQMGAVAPSGLACLDSGRLVGSTKPTLVAALFNMQKVTAFSLDPSGATFAATPFDLAIGSRIDFHPTDILEDADGSLLVIDTGGWYDLCCPTSRVDQFTAPGGIYRIRHTGVKENPIQRKSIDWINAKPEEVVQLLNDTRPWVARQALLKIASSGDWATDSLRAQLKQDDQPLPNRTAALWALGAAATPSGLESITRQLLKETSSSDQAELQHIGCNLIALHRFRPAREAVQKLVQTSCSSKQYALARAAIEALGKIGDESSVSLLFDYAGLEVDRVFDHSLRFALYELNRIPTVARFLESSHLAQRRLALSTLDLLSADKYLTAAQLVQDAQVDGLSDLAMELLIARPHYAEATLEALAPNWNSMMDKSIAPPAIFQRLAVGWRDQPVWQSYIARSLDQTDAVKSRDWRESILRSRAGVALPTTWIPWIQSSLKQDPVRIATLLQASNLANADQAPLVLQLLDLARDTKDRSIQQQLLISLPPKPLCNDPALVAELTEALAARGADSESTDVIWRCLKRLKLSEEMAQQIVSLASKFSPSELIQAAELVAALKNDTLDEAMLKQLETQKSARAIPTSSLINVYRNRSESIKRLAQSVADKLIQSDPQVQQTVQSLLKSLPQGDQVRGLTLFHSSKANCGACHQMGYRGGKIGPELSRIGSSRTREAILEAILFPSQRIEQGFDSERILTLDGRVLNGIVVSRSNNEIHLRVSADKIETIPLSEIEEQQPSEVSIMPAGMLELLSPQELADLLSLLEAAK